MGSARDLVGEGPVMVLAPHADDEVLGCGGLLADCWSDGIPAHVACLTDGAASHRTRHDLASIRASELARTVAILGGDPARDLTLLRHPDARLHEVPEGDIVAGLLARLDTLGVRIVIAPSPLDAHCDHVTTAAIADRLVAARAGLRLFHYPIWSRWAGGGTAPMLPGSRRRLHAVDPILKARAIAAHASQQSRVIDDDPHGFAMPAGFAEMFANGPEIFDERGI